MALQPKPVAVEPPTCSAVPPAVLRAALELWDGDQDAAMLFLERPHPLLEGLTPREAASISTESADRVVRLIGRADAGVPI